MGTTWKYSDIKILHVSERQIFHRLIWGMKRSVGSCPSPRLNTKAVCELLFKKK